MKVENCTCGNEPLVESSDAGARNWDVCCFECGARSAMFPNKSEAIMSWNHIVNDNVQDSANKAREGKVSLLLSRVKRKVCSALASKAA